MQLTHLLRGSNKKTMAKMNHNGATIDGEDLANAFNYYFVIVTPTNGAFDINQLCDCIRSINESVFFFRTTNSKIISTLVNFKNSNSKDVNNMQLKPIKFVIDLLKPVLTHIFNLPVNRYFP